MVNFFDNPVFIKEIKDVYTEGAGSALPEKGIPSVSRSPVKNGDSNIGLFLSGIKNINGTDSYSDMNFFAVGQGISTSETESVNVQEQTQKIAAFKIAYSNFKSNPTKETALKLKEAYYGNGNKPILENRSVRQLYETQKCKIEKLINNN